MPSGLFLFCTFLFSSFRYENAKQIICIYFYVISLPGKLSRLS